MRNAKILRQFHHPGGSGILNEPVNGFSVVLGQFVGVLAAHPPVALRR
jgi:hypothetical protein